ncbi:site-specific integrase [Qipengyuania gaetbuli]|nr:site-specific integrase [Qipengyuania gaetbuli]
MPKRKLDAAFCHAATCPKGKSKETYWDTQIKGFVLETRETGGKTYCLRYMELNGRQRQIKIGGFTDITFAQAKTKAQALRSEVVLGGDPYQARAKKRSTPTYAQLAQQHIDHAKTYQKTPANTEAVIRTHLLPRWGRYRLDEIKQQAVAAWLAEKRKTLAPATVEKLRVTLGRSYNLGRQWGISGAEVNPVQGIPRFKFDNARERYLTADEAQRLILHAHESTNERLGAIVELLLLTGARKTELLTAKWEHVDLERRSWFIPDTKTGKARHVPLSAMAMQVIETLPRIAGCPYMLANPQTKKPYTDLKHPFDTARRKAGLPNLRIHDLRHSAASFMVNAGIDLLAIGKVLGHADYQSTMRYSHLANDTLRAAVEAGAKKMRVGEGQ